MQSFRRSGCSVTGVLFSRSDTDIPKAHRFFENRKRLPLRHRLAEDLRKRTTSRVRLSNSHDVQNIDKKCQSALPCRRTLDDARCGPGHRDIHKSIAWPSQCMRFHTTFQQVPEMRSIKMLKRYFSFCFGMKDNLIWPVCSIHLPYQSTLPS